MIVPKLNYVLIFLWLVFRGIQLNKECKMNLFYATTKVLGPPCFYQARRVKKHVTLLSVHQFCTRTYIVAKIVPAFDAYTLGE